MFEVRVETDFAAAHFLRDYHGKCENLHGHNYKVYVHVSGSRLDEGGMLLDFTQLKKAVKQVCGLMDHTNLNDIKEFDDNPSAERIAYFIYTHTINVLTEMGIELSGKNGGPKIKAVDVFETEHNRARYIAD